MKALEFIEEDIRRLNKNRSKAIAFSALLFIFSAIGGFLLRGDWLEAFGASNLIPLAMMIVAGVCVIHLKFKTFQSFQKRKVILFLSLSVLGFSMVQPQTPVSLAKFQNPGAFWPEVFHCLGIGLGTSFLASWSVVWMTQNVLPAPNRFWQLTLGFIPGLCGLIALTAHCMGPLFSHTVVSHWGQAFIIFPMSFLQQRFLGRRRIRSSISQRSDQVIRTHLVDRG